jgi:hypothetical protein
MQLWKIARHTGRAAPFIWLTSFNEGVVDMNRNLHLRPYSVLCLVLMMLALPLFASAQTTSTPMPTGTQVEIIGVVSEINVNSIVVAGVPVDVSGVSTNVTIGSTISVTGLLSNSVIVAQTILIINTNLTATPEGTAEATPEATVEVTAEVTPQPTPTSTPAPNIIVIEGPVINIINNIITIYDFDVEVEPQNPILTIIDIGDIVRVEGAFSGGNVIVATVVSNITTVTTVNNNNGPATVGLEGPVESINGNIIVVNGISVELGANDPLLQTVQVGNFVNVQGNFQNRGNVYVLVVVNVVIINDIDYIDNDCWFHEDGMGMGMGMGHWHCDGMGMGMGMGDDGMGMGMGMGMGR